MSDMRELYQEVILDHNKRPRNFLRLEPHNRASEGYNPLCGDQLTVYLDVQDGIIEGISFIGSGCAISKASASLMTAALKGKTEAEADAAFRTFHALVTGEELASEQVENLGKLAAFSGVREYPARVKCASLAWHTMQAALHNEGSVVSTE